MKACEFMSEIKDITAFLAGQTPLVTVPPKGRRAQIFSNQDRAAIERFVPQARGMTDHEALDAAKDFLETFLNRVKAGITLNKSDQRVVSGLYDIISRQTDRYDTFMKTHGLYES